MTKTSLPFYVMDEKKAAKEYSAEAKRRRKKGDKTGARVFDRLAANERSHVRRLKRLPKRALKRRR